MPGHYTSRRSDTDKLSDCIKYITGDGGFHSFGQFLSTLLGDPPNQDQVVIQTVSRFFQPDHLRPLLDKVCGHRLMKGKVDMQSVVPSYGFHLSNLQEEGTSDISKSYAFIPFSWGTVQGPTMYPYMVGESLYIGLLTLYSRRLIKKPTSL